MAGEPISPPVAAGVPLRAPRRLLYSIFARIGGSGLDTDAFESLRASARGGFLGKAVAYDNRQEEIPAHLIKSLRWHPVRLLSFLDRPYYYGAKKHYLDWVAARELAAGDYDLFHSWSGDCLRTLRAARDRGVPSVLEIPTWHRDAVPQQREPARTGSWKDRFLLGLERFREEYDLASLILVLSEAATETFRERGFPEEKLFYLPRGVDVERFRPGKKPPLFRAVFSGALIERKGIHHLLEAWHRLDLKEAELWLVGAVHPEAKPHLEKYHRENVRVVGFARNPEEYLKQGTIHIFPSQWEGSAKTTYEAAACGLPQVITRESGDVVRDGVEGLVIPPANVDRLAEAIRHLYDNPALVDQMSEAARRRVVENFTWDHFRSRLLVAYDRALRTKP